MPDEIDMVTFPTFDPVMLQMSTEFRVVQSYTRALIKQVRLQNESQSLDQDQTSFLRGKISAYKEILAMCEPEPQPPKYNDRNQYLDNEGVM